MKPQIGTVNQGIAGRRQENGCIRNNGSEGASDLHREDLHRSVMSDLNRTAWVPWIYIDLHILTYLDFFWDILEIFISCLDQNMKKKINI